MGGCNSSSLNPPELANVRVIHASPDAPNVNASIDGTTLFRDVAFGEATRFVSVEAGSISISVDGLLPGDTLATVIGPASLDLAAGTQYSVLAIGPVAEIGPVEVPAGDYQIRVAVPGDTPTVVFDSGAVALPGGASLLIAAIQNTGPGDVPVSLLVGDGGGSFQILDQATPSNIRVVHASPDAPAVSVYVNDDFVTPFLANVPFPAASGYIGVPGGEYNIKVTPAGNIGVIVIDADLDLVAGARPP